MPPADPAPLEFMVEGFAYFIGLLFVINVVGLVVALVKEHFTTKWYP